MNNPETIGLEEAGAVSLRYLPYYPTSEKQTHVNFVNKDDDTQMVTPEVSSLVIALHTAFVNFILGRESEVLSRIIFIDEYINHSDLTLFSRELDRYRLEMTALGKHEETMEEFRTVIGVLSSLSTLSLSLESHLYLHVNEIKDIFDAFNAPVEFINKDELSSFDISYPADNYLYIGNPDMTLDTVISLGTVLEHIKTAEGYMLASAAISNNTFLNTVTSICTMFDTFTIGPDSLFDYFAEHFSSTDKSPILTKTVGEFISQKEK